METAEFDFYLPPENIAERPAEKRDASRLLVLGRDGSLAHKIFSDLPSCLDAGDMIILNDSRVFPARITGIKPTGGKIEFLLVSRTSSRSWSVLSRDSFSGPLTIGDCFTIQMTAGKTVTFGQDQDMQEMIWKLGSMPLPPYIRRQPDDADKERYQTVYAAEEGSIAAPTAGLHFTPELLAELKRRSVLVRTVTLHVGTGTFRPVKTVNIEEHKMDEEHFTFNAALIREIDEVRQRGNRVIAVGTTATRTLEGYLCGKSTVYSDHGTVRGSTDIFIHEGHVFRAINGLITNFHLPRSTPLMLAAAFSGREILLNAYREALAKGYRFFSYGDAMLLL